jgi:hypothetical protein
MDDEPGLGERLDKFDLATQIKVRLAYIIFRLYDSVKDPKILPFIDRYKIDYEIVKAFTISQQIFDAALKIY